MMQRFEGFEEWLPRAPAAVFGDASSVDPDASSQWLAALYDSEILFSGLLDRTGRVIEANRLSVEGCGFDRNETIGRPFWESGWWSPDPRLAERMRQWCLKTLETGQSLRAVCRYFRADASSGMVDLGLVPIIDFSAPGEPVSYIVASGLDISPLLSAQAAREDRLAAEAGASKLAEQRFRGALDAMIDQVTIAYAVRDDDGAIVDFQIDFINQASVDGAGRTEAELVGRRVCELYPSWIETGLFARFVTVVESGEAFIADRLAYTDTLPDGRVISGFWDIQVVKLDDGYIAASRDVTDIVAAEAAIRLAEESAVREQLSMEILQGAALSVDLPEPLRARLGLHYQPAVNQLPIGGDWYDVISLDEGSTTLIIADVAGHGPQIASLMVQLRNILRTIAAEEPDPATLLHRANQVVIALHGATAPFTTCCVATVDGRLGELRWSVAGHPPGLLRSADGQARFLWSAPGIPLGVSRSAAYATATTALSAGDRLILYTDGLIERRDESLELGMERLRGRVEATSTEAPQAAAEDLACVVSAGTDDVALIVFDVAPRSPAV